ncbi:hypothetical protein OD91_1066 [Lutibacter sp. Hel_I_33_5]|uniref:hypothetical protein n=1 Tax=Lutibacter sp. Hel_I_33_5 TaxID=1566289 RepID=UPI0011A586F1|nr:hypothetical protein [Lutibacter sp. Hel_I_33_5]TVZ55799.1 hypothetical protein OD91_1066 [Lutibacter sp. Hel_I_33_5]
MKKLILSVFAVGALLVTGCKSEKKEAKEAATEVVTEAKEVTKEAVTEVKEAAKTVVEKVESALAGVSIPNFENAEVTKHLQNYASYANDYIAAKGDVLKNASLAKKGIQLAAKGKDLLGSLSADDASKFKGVMSAIQSKMAPAK